MIPIHKAREVKIIQRILLSGVVCGATLAPSTGAAQTQKLLAPAYPGAVRDTTASDVYHVVLLSRDPIEKVRAYYRARVGKLDDANDYSVRDNDGRALMCQPGGYSICFGKILMTQGNVARYLKHVTDAYDAGVRVEGRRRHLPEAPPPDSAGEAMLAQSGFYTQAQLEAAQAKLMAQVHAEEGTEGLDPEKMDSVSHMSDIFDGLKDEVASRKHSEDELLRLHARYAQLETAVYPYVIEKGSTLTSYDRWLLQRRKAKLAKSTGMTGKEKQELADRLQRLYAAGKFDEAKKLSDRVAARGNVDRWSYWVDFLKDLDAHAYRTRITIDVDPRSWGRKR